MKKIVFTTALFFAAFITNAQTLEGEWKFEKIKLFDEVIYFDDPDKDKDKTVKAYIKATEMGMKADKKTKEEIEEMKKQVTANKDVLYKSGKDQYKGSIDFKGDFLDANDTYNGNGKGKLYFNYLNDVDKMELVESKIDIEDNILTFSGKRLFDTYEFEILLKANKLILTDLEEPPMIIYYERRNE